MCNKFKFIIIISNDLKLNYMSDEYVYVWNVYIYL